MTERRIWLSLARWRHRKRQSEYEVLTSAAQAQCVTGPINEGDCVTVYQDDGGNWWVRKSDEFQDGRFERIDRAGDTAGPALCARPREKVEAALAVAKLALARIAGGPATVAMNLEARRALSDILTLTE